MSVLKKVGFMSELSPLERAEVRLSNAPEPDEEKIIRYLEAGSPYATIPGVEEDIFAEPPHYIGSTNILTDGTWAWPQTLVYYIRRYHIRLPSDFVEHMRSGGWQPLSIPDVNHLLLEGEFNLE